MSPNTVAAYRDTFKLLLRFVQETTGVPPHRLQFEDLDASRIATFLDHLEKSRGVKVTTRNARLAAIHSLFRYAALEHPEHGALIQRVLAIPVKRTDRAVISFLSASEIDALLKAPDRPTWRGRRDHALLVVAVQTGMRVSELVGLRREDVTLGPAASIRCEGKGRKERITPLTTETAAVLRVWLQEHAGEPTTPLFPGPHRRPLTRDAVRRLLSRHVTTAAVECPSLVGKAVTPHVLRHSCAMAFRGEGIDLGTIGLWLGHESIRTTAIYEHADLGLKERALARTSLAKSRAGRYRPDDALLRFLESL